jgi:chorismate mutase
MNTTSTQNTEYLIFENVQNLIEELENIDSEKYEDFIEFCIESLRDDDNFIKDYKYKHGE